MTGHDALPPAWSVLLTALETRQPVRAQYHGHPRVLCPHALGWKIGRAKVISYQSDGSTSKGPLPADPNQRWRCMFVDELENVTIIDGAWATSDNHSQPANCLDQPPVHEIDY